MSHPKFPCYCTSLHQASNRLRKYYDRKLSPLDLTANQFFLLQRICRLGSCNKSQLAADTRLDRTTIIRNLDLLMRKKLVEECPDQADRNQPIQLTQLGKKAIHQGRQIWAQTQKEVEQALGPQRLSVLLEALAQIESLAEQ